MFQLIVAVISIALVAALAIASIYYGGSAFNQGTLKANVVTLVNAGQQISGAQALYVTDFGNRTSAIVNLTNGVYLQGPPATSKIASGAWTLVDGNTAFVPFVQGDTVALGKICDEVVKQAGTAPGATSAQFYCSTDAGAAGGTAGLAFKL